MKKIKKIGNNAVYTLTLQLNGEKSVVSANTLEEALKELPIPLKYGTRGVFTAEKDGKVSRPVALFIPQMRKLFGGRGLSSEIQRTVLIKRLSI